MEVVFPQKHLLEGEFPFNMKFKDSDDRIDIWMLSTKIPLPDVIFKGEVPLYPFYWDTPETPDWTPRYEILLGTYSQDGKHGAIHKKWGTQPLNTYIRGHFCLEPHPRAVQEGEHVLVQQYFKSGWWGNGNRITIKEQLQQNKIGLQLLRQLGILKAGVSFHFFDQTKPTQDTFGLKYALFKAETLPDSYSKYLPNYLREWRYKDFSTYIEEVIEDYVEPNLP
ncbi:MAG: hypothetical protein E3J73_06645 [Candidatus Bathyarchaeum sp.]|nr:MAG: hypothetical protein E3J73_06645 [Candidatus Bathyarchaeum sp.]